MTNKLMTHMVCGYPSIEESQKIFDVLNKYSQYIEVQFPFSDPIADGPIIAKANEIALKNNITTNDCFKFLEQNIKKENTAKLFIMTYYNIVLNYGLEKFIEKASLIGVYGVIIPDVPFDEKDGELLRKICKNHKIVFTEIVSPITTNDRLNKIKNTDPQLIYAISQNMTTGSKANFGQEFEEYIQNLKSIFSCSIGVGFGVKTKQDVEKVNKVADFAIIGSEFIKKYNIGKIEELENYIKNLK